MAPRAPNGSAVTPRTQSSMRSASSWTKIEVSSLAPAGKKWFQAGCQRARSSARSATMTPRPIRVT
jgi:hypothetical protein